MLDGGRHNEKGGIFSKSAMEWEDLLRKTGFKVDEAYSQVSPFLWKIYDIQTRPFLKFMIRLNRLFKDLHLKWITKILWVYFWFPIISVFYFIMARPKKLKLNASCTNVFLAMEAKPV
jgi:hypothetical protein